MMNRSYSKPYVFRYTALSFVCGLIILFFILFTTAVIDNIAFTPLNLGEIHRLNPILYIIDIFPIIITVLGYYISRYISIIKTESTSYADNEQTKAA